MTTMACDPEFARIFESLYRTLEDRQRKRDEHRVSCTATSCDECERYLCGSCKRTAIRRAGTCRSCRGDYSRAAAEDGARFPIPFAEARLGSPVLERRFGPSLVGRAVVMAWQRPNQLVISGDSATPMLVAIARGALARDVDRALSDIWNEADRGDSPRATLPTYRFVSAVDLASARGQTKLGQPDPPSVADAMQVGVLVLADVGIESPRLSSAVREILHRRFRSGLRTWMSTELDRDAFARRYGSELARAFYGTVLAVDREAA